ncbi:hypothetical protein [Streptomyces sp. NBC_00199]|uniref:hypothetical protein n=1 Tax=Streptomyces sp. NBC_00199 TaxID=2975678 RepID=UPI00224EC3F8|nr:hypothetical protein [Streptomyces sp. NBC_00199]MCX5262704.1 hypothetical protein [Streptomyces sp. NBC_00199]
MPAAVHAVLLILFVLLSALFTLLGPLGAPALGGAAVPAPREATHSAGVSPAHSTPHTQDADPAVPSATVRSGRDAAGERPTPPAPAARPQLGAAGAPLPPGRTPTPAADPPAPDRPAHRPGVRAPPALSGT